MILLLTEQEREYLVIKDFTITIKNDCPPNVRKTLQNKIDTLNRAKRRMRERTR